MEGLDDIVVSLFDYCGVISHFDIDETCLRLLVGRLRAEYASLYTLSYGFVRVAFVFWLRVVLYD